ncbi:hypothetical protein Sme01_35400 [Sphaerisporangium melleum]|uniref:Uncharacterized protein n=1 Tax=Sphaerisporangium melleum TaxID=321316 RepID=A0A917RAI0_9ACTN|nr:hypothetical protein [Sphaerisporangium melleum]GGK97043.1 hypothetical protein GCM10007964_44060 [Sphaerisporangium melleum]GII71064.1 hypothetical protein Sme01_35400 [Sphaerisporangium melleum]
MRIRRALALSAALTVLAVGLPAASAFSADGKEDCKNVTNGGSQSDPQCFWMADPAEALDIVRFWAKDDGAKLKEAGEYPVGWIDCTVEACSAEGEGDGEAHGEGDPAPEGYQDDNTPPTCQTAGETCSVSPEEIAAAAKTAAGQAIAAAAASKMRVWVDTELLDDYQAGTAAFAAAVRKVAALAAQPGVVGIRFTSQLGYNGAVKTAEEMNAFVTAAATALHTAAPGKKLGVHTVVPSFGCGANDPCAAEMAKKYPLLSPEHIEPLLTSGSVDQLALDSGLLQSAYATWKITPEQAQRNQWSKVKSLAWDTLAQIAAEDAGLAGKDASPLTAEQAAAATQARIATPLKDGAATVNLWTRWQDTSGATYRVMGAGLAATPTWDQLTKLQPLQRRLSTMYSPASPEVGIAQDVKKLSEVFSQVYVTD